MSKLPQGLKAEHIQIKGKAWLLKETTMRNYSWMTPFEQEGMLETYSTGTEKTCSSQRLAKACSRPVHLILMISHNYDCWLNKKESYCPWLLQININCGCPQDLQVQLRVLSTLCPREGSTFCPRMPDLCSEMQPKAGNCCPGRMGHSKDL